MEHDADWWKSSLTGSDHFHLNQQLQIPTNTRRKRMTVSSMGMHKHQHPWGLCEDPHCIFAKHRLVTSAMHCLACVVMV